jgi:hypothetical protein
VPLASVGGLFQAPPGRAPLSLAKRDGPNAEWPLLVAVFGRLPSKSLLCNITAMSNHEAARFRQQAEDCRQQAAKTVSPLDKEAWLRVAEEWLKLAVSVEGRQ